MGIRAERALGPCLVLLPDCAQWHTVPAPEVAAANVIARAPSTRTFKLEAVEDKDPGCPTLDNGEVDSSRVVKICFSAFRAQFESGVRQVLRGLLTESDADPDVTARLRTFRLTLGSLRGNRESFSVYDIVWALELVDRKGVTIVSMKETTRSTRVGVNDYADPDDDVVRALHDAEATILERIRAATLSSAALQPAVDH